MFSISIMSNTVLVNLTVLHSLIGLMVSRGNIILASKTCQGQTLHLDMLYCHWRRKKLDMIDTWLITVVDDAVVGLRLHHRKVELEGGALLWKIGQTFVAIQTKRYYGRLEN
jgi:hypothetical protein